MTAEASRETPKEKIAKAYAIAVQAVDVPYYEDRHGDVYVLARGFLALYNAPGPSLPTEPDRQAAEFATREMWTSKELARRLPISEPWFHDLMHELGRLAVAGIKVLPTEAPRVENPELLAMLKEVVRVYAPQRKCKIPAGQENVHAAICTVCRARKLIARAATPRHRDPEDK